MIFQSLTNPFTDKPIEFKTPASNCISYTRKIVAKIPIGRWKNVAQLGWKDIDLIHNFKIRFIIILRSPTSIFISPYTFSRTNNRINNSFKLEKDIKIVELNEREYL